MKRETRANLIFLAILLAAVLPGAVILFKKKLDPAAHRMDEPDAVRRRIPYMAPLLSPTLIRIVPPVTAEWVSAISSDSTGSILIRASAIGHASSFPATSDDGVIEAAGFLPRAQHIRVVLLLWDAALANEPGQLSVAIAGEEPPVWRTGKISRAETISVPRNVLEELRTTGYLQPPTRIGRIECEFESIDGDHPAWQLRVVAAKSTRLVAFTTRPGPVK